MDVYIHPSPLRRLDVTRTMTRPDSQNRGESDSCAWHPVTRLAYESTARCELDRLSRQREWNSTGRIPTPRRLILSVTLTLWCWSLTHTPLALLISSIRTHVLVYLTAPRLLYPFLTRVFARHYPSVLFCILYSLILPLCRVQMTIGVTAVLLNRITIFFIQ